MAKRHLDQRGIQVLGAGTGTTHFSGSEGGGQA